MRDNDGTVKVYIKGADNIIKQRLKNSIEQPFLKYIDGQLSDFSRIGLRTLLMAMKVLSNDEYTSFEKEYNELSNKENREEELSKIIFFFYILR